jgi:hypothetical protein
MKKKTVRKLQLHRTTLLCLDPVQPLQKVHGGTFLTEYPCPEGSDPCTGACTEWCLTTSFECVK